MCCLIVMDHIYALPWAASCFGQATTIKRKRTGTYNDPRRLWDRKRSRTRINIGLAFQRWRNLRDTLGLTKDADVACFLLDSYHKGGPSTSSPCKTTTLAPSPIAPTRDSPPDGDRGFLEPGIEDSDQSSSERSINDDTTVSVSEDNLENTEIDPDDDDDDDDDDDNTWETASEDSTSDEHCIPSICLRVGRGKKDERKIDELPVISVEETVHLHTRDEVNLHTRDEVHLHTRDEVNLHTRDEVHLHTRDEVHPHTRDEVHLHTRDEVLPLHEEPVLTPPANPKVLCEEDIIGQRASKMFEFNLKQLVRFLQLPVKKCNLKKEGTNDTCQASGPFEVHLSSRGTGTNIEWTCSNGHLIWTWHSQPTLKYGMQAGDFMTATNVLLSGNNYYKVAHLLRGTQ